MDAPNQVFVDQDPQRVVYGLERDGSDLGPDDFGHTVGRDVRLRCHGPQNRQSLGRDLDAALTKELRGVDGHATR